MAWRHFFEKRWWQAEQPHALWAFKPFEKIFGTLSTQRALFLKAKAPLMRVPIVVVGNIVVGGVGKTPILIALAKALRQKGLNVGVVSRGYKRQSQGVLEVLSNSCPFLSGDEPLLIAQKTSCPVFVGEKRNQAILALLEKHPHVDVILSDDGLQHYTMPRLAEWIVFDSRGLGNGLLLPRGPLREPLSRLDFAQAILLNGVKNNACWLQKLPQNVPRFHIQLKEQAFYALNNPQEQKKAEDFLKEKHTYGAISGIGAPFRFFQTLENLGFSLCFQKSFPDHCIFQESDFENLPCEVLFVSEKDAVKCTQFAPKMHNIWVLPIQAQIPTPCIDDLVEKINGFKTT